MESSEQPARVLVVANRTAATPALIAAREGASRARPGAGSRCSCPNTATGLERIADPEDHADTEAQGTLELALPLLEEAAGSEVTGMVGAPEPLDAIQDAINLHGFDEIILSTLPKRVSRWLRLDLPHKLQRPRPADHHGHRQRARGARAPSLRGRVPLPLLDAGADRAVRDRQHDHRDRQALSRRGSRAAELLGRARARRSVAIAADARQHALERGEAGRLARRALGRRRGRRRRPRAPAGRAAAPR